jgi:hypothetical protein
MEKVFLFAICVTVLFAAVKIVEYKYLDKDEKALKAIVRDLLIVFGSAFATSTVFFQYNHTLDEFFSVITNSKTIRPERTQVFTGNPDF